MIWSRQNTRIDIDLPRRDKGKDEGEGRQCKGTNVSDKEIDSEV